MCTQRKNISIKPNLNDGIHLRVMYLPFCKFLLAVIRLLIADLNVGFTSLDYMYHDSVQWQKESTGNDHIIIPISFGMSRIGRRYLPMHHTIM